MEKTMQDMSTGNQPDGSTYEYFQQRSQVTCLTWTEEYAGSNPAYQTIRLLLIYRSPPNKHRRIELDTPSKLMWTGTPLLTEGQMVRGHPGEQREKQKLIISAAISSVGQSTGVEPEVTGSSPVLS